MKIKIKKKKKGIEAVALNCKNHMNCPVTAAKKDDMVLSFFSFKIN